MAEKPIETYKLGINQQISGKIRLCALTGTVTPATINEQKVADKTSVHNLVMPTSSHATCAYTFSYSTASWITADADKNELNIALDNVQTGSG